jgi:mRNA interferase RelE/StbE
MYLVELMPKAIKDLKALPKSEAKKVVEKIRSLEKGLSGDIKKLTNFTHEYRLRVGNYRVLFEIEEQRILVYRIKHRKEAYL